MKKGRSVYTFNLNCDSNVINGLINNFLVGNNFKLTTTKKGETVYKAGDAMMGYTGFLYNYDGQTLKITAWLMGALGDFPVEQNSLNMLAMNYRNSLGELFNEIGKLSNGGVSNNMNNNFDSNTGQSLNQNINNNMQFNNQQQPAQFQTPPNPNQVAQTFQNATTKKQETMCEIGFWISIAGVLISLTGVMFGVLVYVMDFYFASQGLKTRKRGKAIATIVLSSISIAIIIISLIISMQ